MTAALNDRRESMRVGIDALQGPARPGRPAARRRASTRAAPPASCSRKMDVFRLQRVVYGHPGSRRRGRAGRRQRAAAPQARRAARRRTGSAPPPPGTPELKDRFLRKVQWNDEDVVAARNQQNSVVRVADARGVGARPGTRTRRSGAVRWSRSSGSYRALTRALTDFARQDVEDFDRRSAELYRKRVGVSYLLPAGSGRMEQFYQQVVRRLLEQKARDGQISVNSTEADLLQALVGADAWPEAFRISIEQTPEHAVSYLRERVKTEIKKFLREPPPGEQPMLPRLQDLLVEAAGHGHGSGPGITAGLPGRVPRQARRAAAGQLHPAGQRPAEGADQLPRRRAERGRQGVPQVLDQPARRAADHRGLPAHRDRVDLGGAVPHRDGRHRGGRGPRRAAAVGERAGPARADRPAALAAADRLRLRLPGHPRGAPGRDPAPAAVRAVERAGHDRRARRHRRSGSTSSSAAA